MITPRTGDLRPMPSEHHIDRKRGTKDARQQLALLRDKRPVGFPAEPNSVRPLLIGAPGEIASAMGWSLPYTLGVLARWKMAPAYCRAVLAQEHRVAFDGSPAEAIDAKVKDLAAKRLARLANGAAKPAAPVPVKSKPAERLETAEPLRAQVRASLMRRRA
jgi:sRNA-binding protein